ncbi:hypothetical protein CsSME_00043826 [Camellia sinensis var. sinensis]
MSAFGSGNTTTNGVSQSEELCRWFSFVEIQSATNDFDDALVIGKGGFGKVYKGSSTVELPLSPLSVKDW